MFDYTAMYKAELPVNGAWPGDAKWDTFISAYTEAERVKRTYDMVQATSKLWLVFPEYNFSPAQCPPGCFAAATRDEAEYIVAMWNSRCRDVSKGTLCIDMTGFIRPYLLFLLRWLNQNGIRSFDMLYTEPVRYSDGDKTRFSDDYVTEVRQVAGFQGNHDPDTTSDHLIIASGYDHHLIAQVADSCAHARKVQLFGVPSLRADMYQENVLRAHLAEEAVGRSLSDEASVCFAPAYDPFVTASVLRDTVERLGNKRAVNNLYLSPLSTKPQVVGFALYYIVERQRTATSIVFPFCRSYAPETTRGLSRIWRYRVELPVVAAHS